MVLLFFDLDGLFGHGSFGGVGRELMVEGLLAQIWTLTVHMSKCPWARH